MELGIPAALAGVVAVAAVYFWLVRRAKKAPQE